MHTEKKVKIKRQYVSAYNIRKKIEIFANYFIKIVHIANLKDSWERIEKNMVIEMLFFYFIVWMTQSNVFATKHKQIYVHS